VSHWCKPNILVRKSIWENVKLPLEQKRAYSKKYGTVYYRTGAAYYETAMFLPKEKKKQKKKWFSTFSDG